MSKTVRKNHGDRQAKGKMNPESTKDANEMHSISIPDNKSNPFMSSALEEYHRPKLLQYYEDLWAMPFVEVVCWTSGPNDCFLMVDPDDDGDAFEIGGVLDLTHKNYGVRLQVRPGLAKNEVMRMVTKVVKLLKENYKRLGTESFQTLKTQEKQLKKHGKLPIKERSEF
jgi:hypothetical protein